MNNRDIKFLEYLVKKVIWLSHSPVHVLLLRGYQVDSCLPAPCPDLQALLPQQGAAVHQEGRPLAAGHLQRLLRLELHSTG